jgi:hypothetical protein
MRQVGRGNEADDFRIMLVFQIFYTENSSSNAGNIT